MLKKIYIPSTTIFALLGIYGLCYKYLLEDIGKLPPWTILLLLMVLLLSLALTLEFSYFFKRKQNQTYKLFCCFESLVQSVKQLNSTASTFPNVRFKPWYNNYNTYIEDFKKYFPNEFNKMNLEPLPLYENDEAEGFTIGKLATLLQQSEAIAASLKGLLPPEYKKEI